MTEQAQSYQADQLLAIGEVSERTGVARSALHYYEELGLIQSFRTAGNQRRYPRHMLRRISLVNVGRRLGIELHRIRKALDTVPMDHRPTDEDWQRASAEWMRVLELRRKAIEELEAQLLGCIGCGCLSVKACALVNPGDQLGEEGAGARRLEAAAELD